MRGTKHRRWDLSCSQSCSISWNAIRILKADLLVQ